MPEKHWTLAVDTEYAHGEPGLVQVAPGEAEIGPPGPDLLSEGDAGQILAAIRSYLAANGLAPPASFDLAGDIPHVCALARSLYDRGYEIQVNPPLEVE